MQRASKPFDVVWIPDIAGFAVADSNGGSEYERLVGPFMLQSEAQECAALWSKIDNNTHTPDEYARWEQLLADKDYV